MKLLAILLLCLATASLSAEESKAPLQDDDTIGLKFGQLQRLLRANESLYQEWQKTLRQLDAMRAKTGCT